MTSKFTKKSSKFYNIHAHGANLGHDSFFKLPPNVVFIMPSTRQLLSTCLIAEGVMWQMNLLKPDETLLNIKDRIDAYKRNTETINCKQLDFKVYDSRTNKDIYIPEIYYENDVNDMFFSGIVQCPLKLKLKYLKDSLVLPTSTDVFVNQLNIMHNNKHGVQDDDDADSENPVKRIHVSPKKYEFVKKNIDDIESVTNNQVIRKIEDYIQENLGKYRLASSDFCGSNGGSSYVNCRQGGWTYKNPNIKTIENPIISLLYPMTKYKSSKTYIIDGEDKYELIENPTKLSEIIKKYRMKECEDTVLYFFSFSCNEILDELITPTMSKQDLEKAYIKRDTDGMLIDDYMKLQDNFNIKSIEEQENQEIRENISEMSNLSNKDELIKYIQINKLNILRLEQIRDNLNDFLLKQDIIEIINFEKKNDIQYILDELLAVNLNFSINGEFQGMSKKIKDLIKDLIKDCTIDKINKITNKIKNDETFLIKDTVIQLLNEKKQNNIIEQLKEIDKRLINTDISNRESILPDVLKDIEEALNNCSKDDIKIIKDTIEDFNFKQVMTQAVESKEKEIEEKKKEIEEKEKDTDLTLSRFREIDGLLEKNETNNQELYEELYEELNTRKNIDEIAQIPIRINDPKLTKLLSAIKENVDKLHTYEELLNMRGKIDDTFKFKILILNYMENKETEFIIKMTADDRIINKYLKYKKKYINLKKIIAMNK